MELIPIEKRAGLTPEEFQEEYLKPKKPVVFKDLVSDWPATEKWTFDWFKKNYGHLEVPILGNDFHTPGKDYMVAKRKMKFGDYLDLIQAGPTEYRIFLWNIFEEIPELVNDFHMPNIMSGWNEKYYFMFFGGEGSKVNLHYDIDCANVFLTQFQTRKRVVLFDQSQSKYLYHHPFTVQSHVSVDEPDYERFPAFKNAVGHETIIGHGETIFIPSQYWHYITYVDGGYSIALRAYDHIGARVKGFWHISQHFVVDKGMNRLLGPKWKQMKEDWAEKRAMEVV